MTIMAMKLAGLRVYNQAPVDAMKPKVAGGQIVIVDNILFNPAFNEPTARARAEHRHTIAQAFQWLFDNSYINKFETYMILGYVNAYNGAVSLALARQYLP